MTTSLAWITGGATGIGQATAQRLGSQGRKVVISGRRQAELDEAVAQLRAAGVDAHGYPLDVADAAAVAETGARIQADHGPVDVLVCSAGTNVPNRYWDTLTADAFAKVVSINLNGVVYCVQAVLPAMRQAGRGTIVVVSSWIGWRFTPLGGAAYSASKTALAPVVETLNDQEGRHGIRASLVCPGEVDTPILRSRPKAPPAEDLARMLKPGDVGDAIAYLAAAPMHVCINELVISPTWNRILQGAPDLQRGPAAA